MDNTEFDEFLRAHGYTDPVLVNFSPLEIEMNSIPMRFRLFDEDGIEFGEPLDSLLEAREKLLERAGYPKLATDYKWAGTGLLQLAVKDPMDKWRFAGRIKAEEIKQE